MDLGRKILGLLVIAVALAIVAVGCGSGSNTSDGAADASNSGDAEATKTSEVEARQPDEPEASKAFLKPGTKNKIAKFGEEASAEEREAASAVLEENFKARETGEWAKQCSSLTAAAIKNVKEIASSQGGEEGGCAKALGFRAKPLKLTKGLRENTMTGPIDALRFKDSRAYALYHGVGGRDYLMPMEKVGGEWKVDDLLTREL